MKTRSILILIFVVALLGGFLYIIFNNRPIDKLQDAQENVQVEATNENTDAVSENPESGTSQEGAYAMTEVALHATEADCWTAINGTVYDLSTWVSRHPGGAAPIKNLCGKDGSAMFTKQHGTSPKPQSALFLLKIGKLI